jgi:hypothetical protein
VPCSLVSKVITASIIRAIFMTMKAVKTFEMSVYFYGATRLNIPESCYLHTRRRQDLKSYINYECELWMKLRKTAVAYFKVAYYPIMFLVELSKITSTFSQVS